MATMAANTQRQTIGSEEYSLYSSLSEDELIKMAIQQSLEEDPTGQPAAQSHQKSMVAGPGEAAAPSRASSHNPPYHIYPWQRELDPVVAAIKDGDENAVCNMMKSGKDLSEPNKDGWIPLHEAAYYGQVGCLSLLQKAYPGTIDQRTLNEETALYLATSRGNLDCLLTLLQAGAEPDISNKARETPLYKACERKNAEAARLLVQYNADTNHRCNRGWTALHEAVSRNDLEIIDILVKGGAKIESANAYGITSLFVAAESGQLEALRYLAKCGADINTQASDKASALYEACKNGHVPIVEFLLSQGADANKANKDGLLPLHIAAKKGICEFNT